MARGDVIEIHVLCVGGGIAGLMAAIRACELGVKVIVADIYRNPVNLFVDKR